MSFWLRVFLYCILMFSLSFLQGKFIARGPWISEKFKLPNIWPGQSVWGIFWGVTFALLFGFIDIFAWLALGLGFLAALPFIYLGGVKNWRDWVGCNLKRNILDGFESMQNQLAGMARRLDDLG